MRRSVLASAMSRRIEWKGGYLGESRILAEALVSGYLYPGIHASLKRLAGKSKFKK